MSNNSREFSKKNIYTIFFKKKTHLKIHYRMFGLFKPSDQPHVHENMHKPYITLFYCKSTHHFSSSETIVGLKRKRQVLVWEQSESKKLVSQHATENFFLFPFSTDIFISPDPNHIWVGEIWSWDIFPKKTRKSEVWSWQKECQRTRGVEWIICETKIQLCVGNCVKQMLHHHLQAFCDSSLLLFLFSFFPPFCHDEVRLYREHFSLINLLLDEDYTLRIAKGARSDLIFPIPYFL